MEIDEEMLNNLLLIEPKNLTLEGKKSHEKLLETYIKRIQESKERMIKYKEQLKKMYWITKEYYCHNDIEKRCIDEYVHFLDKKLIV